MSPKISVVINTLNEEKRIAQAIRSVIKWADEIIVVDMHSDDRTVEIATTYQATVYLHDRMGFADPAREFAINKAHGDWVLMLDADEMIPKSLSKTLIQIASEDKYDVVLLPYINYFCGSPLFHTGWGPTQDRHHRFFRKGQLVSDAEIHNFLHPVAGARILELNPELENAFVHFNYINFAQFIEKLNRYTSIEAQQLAEKGETVSLFSVVLKPLRGFFRRFVKQQGYKDGWRGFFLSGLWAFYRFSTYAKLIELQKAGSAAKIESIYRDEAEKILCEYE